LNADIQVVFQNSTLVGGVVIGTSADMMINIWGAMIIGGLAGALEQDLYS
jgi:ammonium transporter Rh